MTGHWLTRWLPGVIVILAACDAPAAEPVDLAKLDVAPVTLDFEVK